MYVLENGHLVEQLIEILWRLHSARPHNIALASVNIPGMIYLLKFSFFI